MTDLTSLTGAELSLVIELLERERFELPTEIHHTRTASLRDDLRRRVEMVDRLLERLRRTAGSQAAAA